jgi:hypothetical protein
LCTYVGLAHKAIGSKSRRTSTPAIGRWPPGLGVRRKRKPESELGGGRTVANQIRIDPKRITSAGEQLAWAALEPSDVRGIKVPDCHLANVDHDPPGPNGIQVNPGFKRAVGDRAERVEGVLPCREVIP